MTNQTSTDGTIAERTTGNSNCVAVAGGTARKHDRRQENRFAGTSAFTQDAADTVAAARFLCPHLY
jgi:hypothetical protein